MIDDDDVLGEASLWSDFLCVDDDVLCRVYDDLFPRSSLVPQPYESRHSKSDARWPPEVLSGHVKVLNRYIKTVIFPHHGPFRGWRADSAGGQACLSRDEEREVRRARRRLKNRGYARASRLRRHLHGAGPVVCE